MEYLLGFAMIVVLLLLMGFNLSHIGALVLLITAALVVLTGAFFAACLALVFFSRRENAVFSRVDDSGRFKAAIYLISGEERRNIFPYEKAMQKQLYTADKQIKVLYSKLLKVTVDKAALITIIIGSAVFIPAAVFAVIGTVDFLSGLEIIYDTTPPISRGF